MASGLPAPRTAGGDGEGSYSRQSRLWSGMGSMLTPSLKEAILNHLSPPAEGSGAIHYADFGCSVGANTLRFAQFVADTLKARPDVIDRDIVCHFVDLPSNDFNTLFKQLPPFVGEGDGSGEERTWFADGVPGSQYRRMFPRSSLHVAITALTLHYLSETPKSILDKSSPAYNKGKIGPNGSSPAAAEAYAEASRQGLRKFFECRAEEIASGGVLCFYTPGRRDRAHPEHQLFEEIIHFVPPFEKAWKELVNEGVLTEESLDAFNIPICHPSIEELREAIEHPPSAFRIEKLDFIDKFALTPDNAEETVFKDAQAYGQFMVNMFNSGMGPMVGDYLGPELAPALVNRFRQICEKDYPVKKAAGFPMYMSMCVAALIRK
ncbi:hypothetical protein KC19_5G020400 [Ceratodon purpureus]|uniref:Uncharacterized protein n=1 Tax=Ceratodon purpureus TaxID=3225 RepID=A0A8T0HY78_CERPU|nr:hypothetical protein KC19_5G020400 [Ceratodon purpureus]